ncbi:2Fe-2S iron-sulfur cluster-binding protein [Bacillus chungangensis]|uniref:CDP-4-dehydro-6-deoxyglucose reductase n=1 Tax=Bacillus chungangensis TaxID=587633 RepID=A0ABT9WRT3_9BACI|nr:2Fe-2S iron-sulfur cluster-binding protein [Bacillus chungangensis]MDQ0175622.1 CDP-4-dehydro-6-deoxyglucose reductase [Bacillus chungangensis]
MYQISFRNESFTCKEDESILGAARKKAVQIPYGCANGGCGMCKMRVVQGEYKIGRCSKGALADEERVNKYVLTCKTYPLSDLQLKLIEN